MLYQSEAGNLTLAAGGDAMITRKLRVFMEPRATALWDIFRRSDVGFVNLEMLMHEYEHPHGVAGGTFTASEPANLEELEWAGIQMVSLANNHHYDYGEGGVLTNLANVKAAGLVCAGTGRNLSQARAPGYLDTPNGRVALISTSSTFADAGRATEQRPDAAGRPGLNPLRFSTAHSVDRPAFDELRRVSRELGFEDEKARRRKFGQAVGTDSDTELQFNGGTFHQGEEFETRTAPNLTDLEGNLKWIRDAGRMADWVIVSIHSHEYGKTPEEPPDFLVDFARACIDQGADVFLGHGPHFDKGVEIYNGKPILYSLGNFIFQNDTVAWQPAENYDGQRLELGSTPADFYDARSANDTRGFPADEIYWESVVAQCEYVGGELTSLVLHPIDLGYGRSRSQRGRPLLAEGMVARRVLERVQRLSAPFGTKVDIEDAVGVVKL